MYEEPRWAIEAAMNIAFQLWYEGAGRDEVQPWVDAAGSTIDMATGVITEIEKGI